MKTLEKIEAELDKVREERRRAEQDSTSQLPILEGWEGALVWVKRIIKEESEAMMLCEICEDNEPRTSESKWCDSCRDDFKSSER